MSGFASFIFAIIMYVVVRAWSTGTIKLRLSWVILGIIGLYILFALAGALLSMRINELSQEDNSLTWRIRTWLTYIELLSDPKFLLLGGGLGYDHLGPVQEPHNEWIRIIMETGLLGMSFFILIWWKLISILMQISKMADGLLQRRAAGLLAGTAGLLLWASVDSVIRTAPSALLLWAACGMLIGLARSYNERTAPIAKTGEASTPSSPSTAPA